MTEPPPITFGVLGDDEIIREVISIYQAAEKSILTKMARAAERGVREPRWAQVKAKQIRPFLRTVEADMREAHNLVDASLANAVREGYGAALGGDMSATNVQRVEAYARAAVGKLEGTTPRVLRQSRDVYRTVMTEAAKEQIGGTAVRRQTVQKALRSFADRGVTGFVDKAGRSWGLQSYAEMASRSAVGQAQAAGTMDRVRSQGGDLVRVSSSVGSCKVCIPWENMVLSISGQYDGVPTVDEAISAGLFHPNCTHSFTRHVPLPGEQGYA